jgi:hypothetical protein
MRHKIISESRREEIKSVGFDEVINNPFGKVYSIQQQAADNTFHTTIKDRT